MKLKTTLLLVAGALALIFLFLLGSTIFSSPRVVGVTVEKDQ